MYSDGWQLGVRPTCSDVQVVVFTLNFKQVTRGAEVTGSQHQHLDGSALLYNLF